MAVTLVTLSVACVLLAVSVVASPTRRQFVPETTSSVPVVTSDGEVWDDSDEFDLDGDEDWLGESAAASPSSIPLRPQYEDYDDDDSSSKRGGAADEDVEVQDAEEDEDDGVSEDRRNSAEFLFLPSTDRRLMLQDDDGDQSGLIRVRHTGKNSYSEVESNSLEEESSKDEDDGQFEFTIGDDDDDEEKNEDLEKDDFVLEDSRAKESDIVEEIPRPVTRDDEDDNDEGDDDDPMFESPEEDSQVIYGDHVFLY